MHSLGGGLCGSRGVCMCLCVIESSRRHPLFGRQATILPKDGGQRSPQTKTINERCRPSECRARPRNCRGAVADRAPKRVSRLLRTGTQQGFPHDQTGRGRCCLKKCQSWRVSAGLARRHQPIALNRSVCPCVSRACKECIVWRGLAGFWGTVHTGW